MLLLPVLALLAAGAVQDQRVPLAPTFELPSSRHAVVPREPVAAEDVLQIDADGAFLVDGKRFVAAVASDRDALESLEAWLASLARQMPDDPDDTRGYRKPGSGEWVETMRLGALRVRAHRDAPWARVRLVLEGCTDERVGIPRIDFAVRDAGDLEREGWFGFRPPELDEQDELAFEGGGHGIGFLQQREEMSFWTGPIVRVELDVRALRDDETGERRLRYQLGPRVSYDLEPLGPRAGALLREDPDRTWTVTTDGDLRWHEMLAVLDVLRDAGVARPVLVLPDDARR